MNLIHRLGEWPIDSLLLLLAAIVTCLVFVIGPLIELLDLRTRLRRLDPIYRFKMWRAWRHCDKQHRAHRAARERSKAATSSW